MIWIIHVDIDKNQSLDRSLRTPTDLPFCLQNKLLITILWVPLSNHRNSESQGHMEMNIQLPCN